MNTPRDYISIIRFKIVGTLAIFLCASLVTYLVMWHCTKLNQLMVLGIVYALIFATTCRTLIDNYRELRKWKRMLVLALSLVLASSFCLPSWAMVAFPPPILDATTNHAIDTAPLHWSVLNSDATASQPAPKFTLCEAIGAMIVIGAGVIITVGIYRCAKKCLYPPTNSPPTNCPPKTPTAGRPQRLGPQSTPNIFADSSSIGWDNTVSTNGWLDWTGAPITSSFGGVITNNYLTNADKTVFMLTFQSSPDLRKWTPEYLCVTGWVSQTPMSTNVTTIVYDQNGTPFSTNWTQLPDNTSRAGVPIRNSPQFYFKVAP